MQEYYSKRTQILQFSKILAGNAKTIYVVVQDNTCEIYSYSQTLDPNWPVNLDSAACNWSFVYIEQYVLYSFQAEHIRLKGASNAYNLHT
jgi:hypothetical protein